MSIFRCERGGHTVVGDNGEQVRKRQFLARNRLMHGGGSEAVRKKLKLPMEQITEELGELCMHALLSVIRSDGAELTLGYP